MNLLSENIQKDFEIWLHKYHISIYDFFNQFPIAAQFGIYQDYFLQVYDIDIQVMPKGGFHHERRFEVFINSNYSKKATGKTYNSARTAAIQQANKLAEQ